MPRTFKFKPAFREARQKVGKLPWVVNVPEFLSENGKRQELFFATKTEATSLCNELKVRKDNFGNSLASLPVAEITDAGKASELLRPYGVGLLEAVKGYIEIHKQRTASISFLDLCNRYLDAKAGKNARHLKGLRNTRDRFQSLHSILVANIDHKSLEPLVNAIPAGGRNLIIRHLRSYWNFAVRKGYATFNPADRLDFGENKRKEVEVVEPEVVARMLEHALGHDLLLLPYLVVGFFTGVRPEELCQLTWGDIDLVSKEVTVPSAVSKTGTRRFPTLSHNAVAWLHAYANAGGTMQGKIINLQEDALYAHRQKNREAAGITRWVQDAMRHSFASFWLAQHKDTNRLREILGHEGSTSTLWRHYHRGTTEAEAVKFWNIMPPSEPANVISFVA
jgi:integrase